MELNYCLYPNPQGCVYGVMDFPSAKTVSTGRCFTQPTAEPPSSNPDTEIKNLGMANAIPRFLVGVSGFEPEASWTRTKRDTKLRHTPLAENIIMKFACLVKCSQIF